MIVRFPFVVDVVQVVFSIFAMLSPNASPPSVRSLSTSYTDPDFDDLVSGMVVIGCSLPYFPALRHRHMAKRDLREIYLVLEGKVVGAFTEWYAHHLH